MTLIDIFEDMLALGERVKDAEFTPSELTRILRGMVGTIDIKVKTTRDANVDINQIVVGGIYDPHEDEAGYPSITIFTAYNPEQKVIKVSDVGWKQLCIDLIECSGHEIIHQSQYRARDFDIGPHLFVSGCEEESIMHDQNYLGNPDEIDAYGYSIAVEIYLKHRISKISLRNIQKAAMYKAYCNAFGDQHVIVRQLVEFAKSYYSQLMLAREV